MGGVKCAAKSSPSFAAYEVICPSGSLREKASVVSVPRQGQAQQRFFVLRTLIKRKDLIKCKESCCWVRKASNADTVGFIAGIGFFPLRIH